MTPLLEIRGLDKHFPLKKGLFQRQTRYVHALDGIDLDLFEGETLGVVGGASLAQYSRRCSQRGANLQPRSKFSTDGTEPGIE